MSILYVGYNNQAVKIWDSTAPPTPSGEIYGAEWDGTANSQWTRTDAAAEFEDPIPAVNNGTGLSPFDAIMPWVGMVRSTDANAGEIVAIPKYYYKWTRDGIKMKLQISMSQFEGSFVSPAHADRGDGSGERDVVYVGRYHCNQDDYKSTSGLLPKVSVTRAGFRTNIHNLGLTVWQWDYAMYWTIAMLYLVEFADWDSQKVIGYGCGNNRSIENNGLTDSMIYHTGTNMSSKTSYGHVSYRGIEDLWANVYDWVDGIYFSGSTVYCIKNPSLFSDYENGTDIGYRSTNSSFITSWTAPTTNDFEYALCPSGTSGGSNSTYVTDSYMYGASGIVLNVGAYYSQYKTFGLFYMYGAYTSSVANNTVGSRLMILP